MKDFIREVERVQMLNKLISNRRTGNPEVLAKKLGVSRSQLYLIIDYLKDIGLKISFDRKINSFYFEKETHLSIEFTFKVMSSDEIEFTVGGNSFDKYSSPSIYLDARSLF